MQTTVYSLFVCALALSGIAEAKKAFPSYITPCTRSNLEECVLKNAEDMKPYLGSGIACLGIPPISPYIIPQIKVTNGEIFSVEANNITTEHIIDFQLTYFKLDFEQNVLKLEVRFPKLDPAGHYVINGSILGIKFDTVGMGYANFTNLDIKSKLSGELVKKNGKEYLHFTDTSLEITNIDDANIHLHSLSAEINKFINSHSKEFLKAMGPIMEIYTGAIVDGIVKRVFEKYPLEDLFPK